MFKLKINAYLEYLISVLLFLYSLSLSFIYGFRINILTEFGLLSFAANIVNVFLIITNLAISIRRKKKSTLILLCLLQLIFFISLIDIFNFKNSLLIILPCFYLILSTLIEISLVIHNYKFLRKNYLYLLFFLLSDFLSFMMISFSIILFFNNLVDVFLFSVPSLFSIIFYTILIIKFKNVDNSINPKFNYYLSFKRKQYNLSQAELGKYLNVSNKMISKWERGSLIPSIEYLIAISILFKDDLESIIKLITENSYE